MKEHTAKTIKTLFLSALAVAAVILCICLGFNKDIVPIEADSWAMGSAVSLKIYTDSNDRATALSESTFSAVANVDSALSDTIADSDISKINADAGKLTEISSFAADKLSQTVLFCKDCANYSSDGAVPVDITIGGLTSLWNIGSGDERVPAQADIIAQLNTIDIRALSVDKTENTAVINAGQQLDMGAFGKGIAADEAYSVISEASLPAIADIGGTVLLFGSNPNTKDGSWSVGIRNPLDISGSSFCMTAAVDTSKSSKTAAFISTSGSYEKYFTENGKRYHHILSIKTGYPVETTLVSVTVISYNSGLEADGLSTALFTMGLNENTLRLLNTYSAQAVFIDVNGNYYATDDIVSQIETTDDSFTLLDLDSFVQKNS